MITFQVDLFHPGAFARSWRTWFAGFKEWRQVLLTCVADALSVLDTVGINIPGLYDLYRQLKAHRAPTSSALSQTHIEVARTTFNVDLLHTGELAKTWLDWFVDPRARSRLLYSYIVVALAILVIVGTGMPKQYALSGEQQAIQQLTQKTTQRKNDREAQRVQFRGITELGRYEIIWSGVLRTFSEAMPRDLWLQSIEFIEVLPTPKPEAVAAKEPQEPSQQLFRLVLVTPLVPGSTHLVELNRFLNDLNGDPGFKEKFRLQDWEVTPLKNAGRDEEEQHLITTVTFRLVS